MYKYSQFGEANSIGLDLAIKVGYLLSELRFDPYLTPQFRDLTNNITKQNFIAKFDRKIRLKIPTVYDEPYFSRYYKHFLFFNLYISSSEYFILFYKI